MFKKMMRRKLILGLVSLMVVVCVVSQFFRKPLIVVVQNNSGEVLTNLSLVYTGGSIEISTLDIHEVQQFRIKPTGETDLRLSYQDYRNNSFDTLVGVYLEPGYSGEIKIVIGPSGDVHWEEDVRIW